MKIIKRKLNRLGLKLNPSGLKLNLSGTKVKAIKCHRNLLRQQKKSLSCFLRASASSYPE